MKTQITIVIFLVMLCFTTARGAIKVDASMVENEITYKLCYSIPSDFDSTKQYPLIVAMHYCGGTAQQYRDALATLADSLRMIVVCPDNKSVVIPESELNMLITAIDSSKAFYPINENEVYLTGMSCNGEYITRHGLNNFYPFKGIFPWNPWITAANPALYNFDCKTPIVISVGSNDTNYKPVVAVYDSLKAHNADVYLEIVPNVGHALPGNIWIPMINCIYYMNGTPDFSIQAVDDMQLNDTDSIIFDVAVTNPSAIDLQYFVTPNNNSLVKKIEILPGKTSNTFSVKVVGKPKNSGQLILTLKALDAAGKNMVQGFANINVNKTVSSDEMKTSDLKIFPVPVDDMLYFSGNEEISSATIVDLSGREVMKKTSVSNNESIDVKSLPKGIYTLIVESKESVKTVKFQKK
jgi:hypothetical protein